MSVILQGRGTKPAQMRQLDRQIIAAAQADHPATIRNIFYRMVAPDLPVRVAKNHDGYRRVQRRIKLLRRSGEIPYSWVRDMSRTGFFVPADADGGEFLQRVAGLYRHDLWRAADTVVEVWCESRSLAGVLQDETRRLAVTLWPCGGYASISLAWNAAQAFNGSGRKRACLVYVGDHDADGLAIPEKLEAELLRHLDGDIALEVRRIAVTPEQIDEYGLPWYRKKGVPTVEAEAIPPSEMRRLVRREVETFLPSGALEAARIAEASERAILYQLGGEWGSMGQRPRVTI